LKKTAAKPSTAASRKPPAPGSRARTRAEGLPGKPAPSRPTPVAARPKRASAQSKPAPPRPSPVAARPKPAPDRPSPVAARPKPAPARAKAAVSRVPVVRAGAASARSSSTGVLMSLHEGIVYGPIRSRRLGRSLGINLTPAHLKLCTFNCSYCQYGWSEHSRRAVTPSFEHWPSPATVAKAVAAAIRTLASQGERIDRLTLAGHGEPTLHPKFKDVVDALRTVRDDLAPGVPLAVLSNASTLERADVREALAGLDERYMKLDAGDTATLRTVNGATMTIEQLVAGLKKVPDIVIQSMFVKDRTGRIDNTGDLTVINWVGAIDRIKPKAVQVYTIDRAPAFPYLQQVPPARLLEIALRVRLAGFRCDVFGLPDTPPEPPKA